MRALVILFAHLDTESAAAARARRSYDSGIYALSFQGVVKTERAISGTECKYVFHKFSSFDRFRRVIFDTAVSAAHIM